MHGPLTGAWCAGGISIILVSSLAAKPAIVRFDGFNRLQNVLDHIDDRRRQFEADLLELLRIPSVSADPAFAGDVRRAAEWVRHHLTRIGLAAELIDTDGHPIVYAESPPVPGAPVALVYGHYDVQPPDPLDEWITPPFEPTIRDGKVFARGATDDKGQMLTHVKSVESWLAVEGKLPLQVKFLIEGEEEVGSEHIASFLKDQRLACDCVVISDGSQFAPGFPAICYGLRGLAYFEVFLTGPTTDKHSGVFGGGIANPANALTGLLAGMVNIEGRVQVPGFYDDVVALTSKERSAFAALPFDDEQFMRQIGVSGLTGEIGYTTLERRWARPAFDVNGLTSGYQGDGSKTVLPAKASAKFSFRLVPNQDPKKIEAGVQQRIEELLPKGIKYQLVSHTSSPAFATEPASPFIEAASLAITDAFGLPAALIREGGSIPILTTFSRTLSRNILLLGWGLDTDGMHSPNEHFSLADFQLGIKASASLWQRLSELQGGI